MTLDLTLQEVKTLWQESLKQTPPRPLDDCVESIMTIPSQLGCGTIQSIDLQPNLDLHILNGVFHNFRDVADSL